MRVGFSALLGLASSCLLFAPVSSAAAEATIYSGEIDGAPATARFVEEEGKLRGTVDASGYLYQLHGDGNLRSARGVVSDPQQGGSVPFELRGEGDALTLVLVSTDPSSGEESRAAIHFRKARAGGAAPTPRSEAGGARDPVLIGLWQWCDSMSSSDGYSLAQCQSMQLDADGRYRVYEGRIAGGGPGVWGGGGDGSAVAGSGSWQTSKQIVQIREGGSGPWSPYARYYVEQGRMLLTFGDGSKQIWSRQ